MFHGTTFSFLFFSKTVEVKCSRCERTVKNCKLVEIQGRLGFIEIVRLNYSTGRKTNVMVDFSKFISLSLILHLSTLRKYHFLIFKTILLSCILMKYMYRMSRNGFSMGSMPWYLMDNSALDVRPAFPLELTHYYLTSVAGVIL